MSSSLPSLYLYTWGNTPYNAAQLPNSGVYRSRLSSQCVITPQGDYDILAQPTVSSTGALTSPKLLFQESWDEANLLPDNGSSYFRSFSGLTMGSGVFNTTIQNLVVTYTNAILPAPAANTQWVFRYFVNTQTASSEVGVVMIFPQSTNLTRLTSGVVYILKVQNNQS